MKSIKQGWINLRRPLYKKGKEIPVVDTIEIAEYQKLQKDLIDFKKIL